MSEEPEGRLYRCRHKYRRHGIEGLLRVLAYLVFSLWVAVTILPLLWMLYSSFKSNEELTRDIYALPHDLLDNQNDEYLVIDPSNSLVLPYNPKIDKRERLLLESTTIGSGRHYLVFFLLKSRLPPEVAQLPAGSVVTVSQLPRSIRWNIHWRTVFFNYISSIQRGGLISKFWNSVFYSTISTLLVILLGAMIGFAMSMLPFPKISRVVMALIGLGYLISIPSLIIPLFLMLSKLKLTDSYVGIIAVYTAFGLPLSVLLLTQFMRGLPLSLIESAYIDGASSFRAFFSIIFPMCTPVVVTVSIIGFLGVWNEFLMVLILASSESTKSLPVGVYSFSSLTGTQLGWQLAALVIATAPAALVYFRYSGQITRGVVAGAVKG